MSQPLETFKVSLCDEEKMLLTKEYVASEPRKKLSPV